MKTVFHSLAIFSFFALFSRSADAQLLINEFSCSNLKQLQDQYLKHEDWIELYNAGNQAVDLKGYYLSDDPGKKKKWKFPASRVLAPKSYIIIFTSGRDEFKNGEFHTSFKLSQTKNESILLSDPDADLLDQTNTFIHTQLGHSYGRNKDGAAGWSVFTKPTPGATNNTSQAYKSYAATPVMDQVAGFYKDSLIVEVTSSEPNAVIRYTLNGDAPTLSSPLYTGPVKIQNTRVLKATAFSNDAEVLPSFIAFNTFFINEEHVSRVISVAATTLKDLANGTGTLEPIGSLEYFDQNKVRKAATYGEFNRHGQDSWANSHRSLDFIARDEMGYHNTIQEKMFTLTDRDEFQRIILRAAGDDNYPADHSPQNDGSAHMRDAYIQNLAKKGGLKLDVRIGEKAVIYINGEYWGLYDIRERPDDHDYIEHTYDQDKYHIQYIQTWGSTWAEYGGDDALSDWQEFYDYAYHADVQDPKVMDSIQSQLDLVSMTDYILVNAFTVCSDWLNYNTGWWRGIDPKGKHKKWGFTLWDNDATFGFYINYTGIPNTNSDALPCDVTGLTGFADVNGHMRLFNRLRQNEEFNNFFINRQIDLWNTVFSCENMLSYFDSVMTSIEPEMERQALRWGGTYDEWRSNALKLRAFISERCNQMPDGFKECYDLTGPYEVTLKAEPADAGAIRFNSLLIDQLPWTGQYFGGVPSKLEALPKGPYDFAEWTSDGQLFDPNPTDTLVHVDLASADTIVAHFSIVSAVAQQQPITEVKVYPTVVSGSGTMYFELPQAMPVSVDLLSAGGARLRSLIPPSNKLEAGVYTIGLDLGQGNLPAGMYFIRFRAGDFIKTLKVIYQPGG